MVARYSEHSLITYT